MKYLKILSAAFAVVLFCSFAAEWIMVNSSEGRFKLKFPRQPTPSTQTTTVNHKPIKVHAFMYDASKYKDDNMVYYIMYCDYPKDLVNSDFRDEIVDTIFNGSLNGAAANMGGKLVSISKNNYKEFPGRSAKFDISNGEGFCYMNEYLVHSRMYLLMCVCDSKKDNNADMQKFFSSFEITEGSTAGGKHGVKK